MPRENANSHLIQQEIDLQTKIVALLEKELSVLKEIKDNGNGGGGGDGTAGLIAGLILGPKGGGGGSAGIPIAPQPNLRNAAKQAGYKLTRISRAKVKPPTGQTPRSIQQLQQHAAQNPKVINMTQGKDGSWSFQGKLPVSKPKPVSVPVAVPIVKPVSVPEPTPDKPTPSQLRNLKDIEKPGRYRLGRKSRAKRVYIPNEAEEILATNEMHAAYEANRSLGYNMDDVNPSDTKKKKPPKKRPKTYKSYTAEELMALDQDVNLYNRPKGDTQDFERLKTIRRKKNPPVGDGGQFLDEQRNEQGRGKQTIADVKSEQATFTPVKDEKKKSANSNRSEKLPFFSKENMKTIGPEIALGISAVATKAVINSFVGTARISSNEQSYNAATQTAMGRSGTLQGMAEITGNTVGANIGTAMEGLGNYISGIMKGPG